MPARPASQRLLGQVQIQNCDRFYPLKHISMFFNLHLICKNTKILLDSILSCSIAEWCYAWKSPFLYASVEKEAFLNVIHLLIFLSQPGLEH